MALDAEIKAQLEQYLALLESDIVLQAHLADDANSQKVRDFLEEIVAMSDRLSLEDKVLSRTPSFKVAQKGQESGVEFAGLLWGTNLPHLYWRFYRCLAVRPRLILSYQSVSRRFRPQCILKPMSA